MARLPRYVIPSQPQHLIQRGNNRQAIFAAESDYPFFRDALVDAAERGFDKPEASCSRVGNFYNRARKSSHEWLSAVLQTFNTL